MKKENDVGIKYGEIIDGDFGYDEKGRKIVGMIYLENGNQIVILEGHDPRKFVWTDNHYSFLAKLLYKDAMMSAEKDKK